MEVNWRLYRESLGTLSKSFPERSSTLATREENRGDYQSLPYRNISVPRDEAPLTRRAAVCTSLRGAWEEALKQL